MKMYLTITLALAALSSSAAYAGTVINQLSYDSNGNWYPKTGYYNGGYAIGTTFTVGSDNVLTSFAFINIRQIIGSSALYYDFSIHNWNASTKQLGQTLALVGNNPVLKGNPGLISTFTDLNLTLPSGQKYAAVLTLLDGITGEQDILSYGIDTHNNYSGGELLRLNQDGTRWAVTSTMDLAFSATFDAPASAVPTPQALGGGLLLLTGLASRRQRTT